MNEKTPVVIKDQQTGELINECKKRIPYKVSNVFIIREALHKYLEELSQTKKAKK